MKNTFWVSLETISTYSFHFLSLIILSHILSPSDYGIFGMMGIFISIGNMLVDSGMGGALVRKREATSTDFSTLFCFNLCISFLLYAFFFIISGPVASFYHVEDLERCLKVYGLFIIINAFGVVQNTILVKQLQFKKLAIISIISNAISFLVAWYFALNGWSYWSLIFQYLSFISLRVLGQFFVNRFIPRLTFSIESFKEQFNFGGSILLSNLLNTILGNITTAIIPKISTIAQNGYYVQASKMKSIPVSIMTAILDKLIFPLLCKKHSLSEKIQFAHKITRVSSFLCFTIITICFFCSNLIIGILGEQWKPAKVYLEILFLGSYGACIISINRNIIKSICKTSVILKISSTSTFIGLSVLLISFRWGIMGLIWGFTISNYIVASISIIMLHKNSTYNIKQQIHNLLYSLPFPFITFFYYFTEIA